MSRRWVRLLYDDITIIITTCKEQNNELSWIITILPWQNSRINVSFSSMICLYNAIFSENISLFRHSSSFNMTHSPWITNQTIYKLSYQAGLFQDIYETVLK